MADALCFRDDMLRPWTFIRGPSTRRAPRHSLVVLQQLGPCAVNDGDIVTGAGDMGSVVMYLVQGRHDEAKAKGKEAVRIARMTLGPQHPGTLNYIKWWDK